MPPSAQLLYDPRWPGPNGIGRFAVEVARRLPQLQPLRAALPLFHPLDPWRVAQEIRRLTPAAYFSPGFNAPVATPGVPVVFTVHDLNYVHFSANTTALKRAYFAMIVKPACRRAARVLTVSEFSRQQIIEWARIPAERVLNVGNGVAETFTSAGERHAPAFPYILFVGSQAAHKNLHRLVQALARSKAAREVKLLVTGKPTPETTAWLDTERLHAHVEFAGAVADADLPAFYRGAVALAMPSLFEGFGLPVIEAMACGTAVLTSDRTSLPEVAGDAALIVRPTDTAAIAEGIDQLVFDQALRARLSAKGLARARAFSWDATARAIETVLAEASAG